MFLTVFQYSMNTILILTFIGNNCLANVASEYGFSNNKAVVCYIGTWSVYRQPPAKFEIEDLNPSLCTHAIYAFAGLDESSHTIKSLDPWQDLPDNGGKDGYNRLTKMKNKYPNLKVSLAIGGWNEGSEKYSNMANDPMNRSRFVQSVVGFLNKYNFDGLSLDWEYPTKRGGSPNDKQNFVLLCQELKAAFSKHKYILTAALGAGKETIDSAYIVSSLSATLDSMHMMTYDYHGAWDGRTGANSPYNEVMSTINYMIQLGADPKKLIMGIPLYGRTFLSLETREARRLGEKAQTVGFPGPYTNENGFMGYNEILIELPQGYTQYWDDPTKTPFMVNGAKVVSYDNPQSITEKVKFALDKGLGGCMVWSVETDDFHGGYPLLTTINKCMQQYGRN